MNEIWERLFFKTPINSSFSVTLTIYKYFISKSTVNIYFPYLASLVYCLICIDLYPFLVSLI